MKQTDIPIWERYPNPLKKRQNIFVLGKNKLRRLADGEIKMQIG